MIVAGTVVKVMIVMKIYDALGDDGDGGGSGGRSDDGEDGGVDDGDHDHDW